MAYIRLIAKNSEPFVGYHNSSEKVGVKLDEDGPLMPFSNRHYVEISCRFP